MSEPRTLVIGDVHGHLDRLEGLLLQEGLLTDGFAPDLEPDFVRTNPDVRVIQLGDLGHFGGKGGSPTGDLLSWEYADKWGLEVLWGNHDRALVDPSHAFNGYQTNVEAKRRVKLMEHHGRVNWAAAAHGHLITHAGLHLAFKDNEIPGLENRHDPAAVAAYINELGKRDVDPNRGILDAISYARGGNAPAGGILWRDIDEKLYNDIPQIFGHSADRKHQVRYCGSLSHTRDIGEAAASSMHNHLSYCIDVGGKGDLPEGNCLAAIWLPEKKIVRVDL